MRKLMINTKNFPIGSVYCINHYFTADKIRGDLQAIKNSGLNTVMLWPMIEWDTKNKKPDFTRIDIVVSECEKLGLLLVPELLGEAHWLEFAPMFRMKECTDETAWISYPLIPEKGRFYPNKAPNLNHPFVKGLIKEYLELVVNRYKESKSLLYWNIWDEPYFATVDDYTLVLFREFLKKKYTTIENLNKVWGQTWDQWDQVVYFDFAWYSLMPEIDYYQFYMENTAQVLKYIASCVKGIDSNHPTMCHQIGSLLSNTHAFEVDDWQMAQEVDVFGTSFYHKEDTPSELDAPWHTAGVFSGIRSAAKTKPFILAEVQSHQRTGYSRYGHMSKADIEQILWQSVAHGAKGAFFWKWLPFYTGSQSLGRGLTDLDGTPTERAQVAGESAKVLTNYSEEFLNAKIPENEIAIHYDITNDIRTRLMNDSWLKTFSKHSTFGVYRDLWDHGMNANFIRSSEIEQGALEGKKVMCSSHQTIISKNTELSIDEWITNGGIFIADARFGISNKLDISFPKPPGEYLSEKWGIRYKAITATHDILQHKITSDYFGNSPLSQGTMVPGKPFQTTYEYSDEWEVLGVYAETNEPSFLTRSYGKGRIYISGLNLGASWYQEIDGKVPWWSAIISHHKIEPTVSLPLEIREKNIETSLLRTENGKWILIVINWGKESTTLPLKLNVPNTIKNMGKIYPEKDTLSKLTFENNKLCCDIHVNPQQTVVYLLS